MLIPLSALNAGHTLDINSDDLLNKWLYKFIILLNNLHLSVFVYLRQRLSVMQQSRASMFYKVVRWQKLGKVENEYMLRNFIILAIFVPKIIKVAEI